MTFTPQRTIFIQNIIFYSAAVNELVKHNKKAAEVDRVFWKYIKMN